jgi:hypothetical protein
MALAGLLRDPGTMPADRGGSSAVKLIGRHELDATVAVPVVVPIHHKSHRPLAGLCLAGERPAWVVRPVLDRAEHRFRVGIVIAHPGPQERAQHTQPLQPCFEGGGAHGIAVISM